MIYPKHVRKGIFRAAVDFF